LSVRRPAQRTVAHHIVEDHLTRPQAEAEQPSRLRQRQRKAGHFAISPNDHRFELPPRRFTDYCVPTAVTPFGVEGLHDAPDGETSHAMREVVVSKRRVVTAPAAYRGSTRQIGPLPDKTVSRTAGGQERMRDRNTRRSRTICCIVEPHLEFMKRPQLDERRGDGRPVNGSTDPCPTCKRGTLEFSERYRLPVANGTVVQIPAWVCDTCGDKKPARAEHQPARLREKAKALRARASRQLMKSQALRSRAIRSLDSSAARQKRRG
jgi:hypothetical protein